LSADRFPCRRRTRSFGPVRPARRAAPRRAHSLARIVVLVRLGSRGSRLALRQAELAADRLRAARPDFDVALVPMTTAGDRDRSRPFGQIGERGVFVKEIEEALLEGRIDVAVHSAKDMTSTDTAGLAVGAYLEREDPRDALCGAAELRPGMRIGTASVRRRAQLLALEPGLEILPLRGNVDTRLRKRLERDLDAIVLAAAGLDRLGLQREIGLRFDPNELVPEAGQGAVALQVRVGEEELVTTADHAETRRCVEAERACVARIGAGCLAPVAAHHDGSALTALIAAEDGSWVERRRGEDPLALADELVAAAPA
jgi:hydroxymethylbilane synthase